MVVAEESNVHGDMCVDNLRLQCCPPIGTDIIFAPKNGDDVVFITVTGYDVLVIQSNGGYKERSFKIFGKIGDRTTFDDLEEIKNVLELAHKES